MKEPQEKKNDQPDEAKGKDLTIVVNGRPRSVTGKDLTFSEIVAFPGLPTGPNTMFTVTYRRGAGQQAQEQPGQRGKRQD